MVFAALETSGEWCSVALSVRGEIAALERRAGHSHSELALPMLDQLLRQCGLSIRDLEAIAFGAGPGAFTGLRIACGLAQGLAVARGLPVLGVSSLHAMAHESGARRVQALRLPAGDDWVGCGSGFAAYGNLGMKQVLPEVHPTALAVAQLAAARLAAGEGVDAAQAAPVYLRDKVAFTKQELERQ
jgi:tRNA threonylcarbamoyladenosine biosynthesis protein TsaB